MVDFQGVHFPKEAILYAVFFYLRYPGSYRDLEEIMEERGVDVDHGTLNRWVVKFAPLLAAQAQSRKKPTAESWRMDETYIKVKGKWTYDYRAVDKTGKTLDFMLSERRDKAAARRFFKRAIGTNGVPDRVETVNSIQACPQAQFFGLKRPQILRSIIFPSVFSCSQHQLQPLDTFANVTHLLVIFGVEDDDGNFTFSLITLKTPKDTSK